MAAAPHHHETSRSGRLSRRDCIGGPAACRAPRHRRHRPSPPPGPADHLAGTDARTALKDSTARANASARPPAFAPRHHQRRPETAAISDDRMAASGSAGGWPAGWGRAAPRERPLPAPGPPPRPCATLALMPPSDETQWAADAAAPTGDGGAQDGPRSGTPPAVPALAPASTRTPVPAPGRAGEGRVSHAPRDPLWAEGSIHMRPGVREGASVATAAGTAAVTRAAPRFFYDHGNVPTPLRSGGQRRRRASQRE